MQNNFVKQTEQPAKKPKVGKWPMIGKFLKDVGHFIFDEDKGGDEVKKDLAVLEKAKTEEKAESWLARQKAEAAAQQKAADAKKQAAIAGQKKFWQIKKKEADRFRQEREELLKKKQAVAQHLIKAQPWPPKPEAHRGFSFFKKKAPAAKTEIKTAAPNLLAPEAQLNLAKPTAVLPELAQAVPGESDKERAARKFQADRLKHESSHERSKIENRQWQSFNIVATNLIKEQQSMFFNWQNKILLLVLYVSLSIMACILAYGILLILEKNKLNANDYIFQNLDSIIVEIKKEESQAQEILKFNEKLMAVDYLLKNHIYWTNFFTFLEDNTITDVYYESFIGDLSGKYNVPAAAKDFRSISSQLKVFQAATDKVVSVDSAGAETSATSSAPSGTESPTLQAARVSFNLNLNLNRSLFIKTPDYEQ